MSTRFLREPLLHFLLLGGAIFALYGLRSSRPASEQSEIVVTAAQVEQLAASFAGTWQHRPSSDELDGLIRDYVRDEAAYREAMALGLDQDDVIIRRRLRQKLEFVSQDLIAPEVPSEEQLRSYFDAHRDSFRRESRFTFRQAYLSPQRHGDSLEQDGRRLLATLRAAPDTADLANLGDPLMVEPGYRMIGAGDLAKLFGERFATELERLPLHQWQGPIESGYGVHFVFLSERNDGTIPDLSEVHDAVEREWSEAQRRQANERFFQELLSRYAITIAR